MSVRDRLRQLLLRAYGYGVLGTKIYAHGLFTVANPKNVVIGKNCSINHGVFILGRTRVMIGDNVILSARCMLLDAGLDPATFSGSSTPSYARSDGITIENGAWIGAGAIILPGVTIGQRAIVGAGSVVTKSVGPFEVVAGNPARLLRRLSVSPD